MSLYNELYAPDIALVQSAEQARKIIKVNVPQQNKRQPQTIKEPLLANKYKALNLQRNEVASDPASKAGLQTFRVLKEFHLR